MKKILIWLDQDAWSFFSDLIECPEMTFNAHDDMGNEILIGHGGDDGDSNFSADDLMKRTILCCHMKQVAEATGCKVVDDTIDVMLTPVDTGREKLINDTIWYQYEFVPTE